MGVASESLRLLLGRPAFLASISVTALAGCASPFIESAYRVDPVLVQWGARFEKSPDSSKCARFPDGHEHSKRAKTPPDVMCPLDLDTYVFPQHLVAKAGGVTAAKTAYASVLSCQEEVASLEFALALEQAIDSAKATQAEMTRRAATLPALIEAERNVLATRAAALAKASQDVAEARVRLTAAEGSAANPKPDETVQREADLLAARNALASADGRRATAAREDAAQRGKLDTLQAELDGLPAMRKGLDDELKRLKGQAAKSIEDRARDPQVAQRSEATCMTLRNQLQEEIISRSVQMCEKHLSGAEATSSIFNATFGVAALTQSALAAVVTSSALAQSLATGAAVTTGTQAVINKEIYRNAVVPAIKRAIKGERERRLNLMRANQLRPLFEYQAGRAVSEAVAYHEACSFSSGLELIGNEAEKRVEQSIPEIEARVRALAEQVKTIDTSLTATSSPAERRLAERSKLRLRQEMEILQSRLGTARQGGAN